MTHRWYVTHEIGRAEDEIALEVECECGWSEEIATTKYDKERDAQAAYDAHVTGETISA